MGTSKDRDCQRPGCFPFPHKKTSCRDADFGAILSGSESSTEKDPSGVEQHAPGSKLDSGKVIADEILSGFAKALWAVCVVGTKGAKKYSVGGWRKVEGGRVRYGNAQMRHKLKEWMGKDFDTEIDVLHAAQDAWNALARLEFVLSEGVGKEWLERYLGD